MKSVFFYLVKERFESRLQPVIFSPGMRNRLKPYAYGACIVKNGKVSMMSSRTQKVHAHNRFSLSP
jgi:hypothetical protein